jgi:hypothetical protein
VIRMVQVRNPISDCQYIDDVANDNSNNVEPVVDIKNQKLGTQYDLSDEKKVPFHGLFHANHERKKDNTKAMARMEITFKKCC